MLNKRAVSALLLCTAVALFIRATAVARTWTDSTGKHTIDAEFASLENGVVTLKKVDGTTIRIPLDKLSNADQEQAKRLPAVQQASVKLVNDGSPKEEAHAATPVPFDRPDPTPTRGMTQTLDVDLRTDPRKDFQVNGPVEFTAGRLTLGPAGSVRRVLDAGSQVKLALRLAFTPLNADGQTSTTRFVFQVRDRGDFVVEIVRRREGGKTVGEVQLIDRDAPGEKKQARTLRTSQWKGDFPDSPWIFRHHHGLVTVYCGDKQIVVGYSAKEPIREFRGRDFIPADQGFFWSCGISEPLEISGWSLEQQGSPVACLAVSGGASPSYRQAAPSRWKGKLADRNPAIHGGLSVREEDNLRACIDHRVSPGDTYQDSVQPQFEVWEREEPKLLREDITGRSLTNVAEILGKRHHYYALALAGVGMQFFWVGKDEVAERLLKQAAEISEESLGTWHPDCALVVSALARVYIKTGKLELAEPLLKKVLEAAAAAFGTESFRYVTALREMAVLQQYNGRLAEAETTLRQSVDACKDATLPQRADALIALGELEAVMGERKKADAVLKRAAEAVAEEIKRRHSSGEEYSSLYVPFERANVQRAWLLFHDGQKEMARQLDRAAFLALVQFWANGGPGHFAGWDQPMDRNDVTLNRLTYLGKEMEYGPVMLDIAELFVSLGDMGPALAAVRILDQVPGQTHHQRGAIYRLMSKICAADPNVKYETMGISPTGQSERLRLDFVFSHRLLLLQSPKTANKLDLNESDRVMYWQKHAQAEFEKSAGREHLDTIGILQDQACRQWQLSEAKAAEPILRDAFSRAILLSDRVLSGLPETQAYQFSEANPPPSDLLLSCYLATKQERGRDAYEVVWRAKALASRQFAERRQLLQAASGRPELAKTAEELQTTRQQLAQLSLSNPPEAALERRQQQLASLTQRKEDLERELAKLSEPFRRTRDAGHTSVADMVRRLPAKTAVVDFVERWQWTPPAKALEPWGRTRCYDAFVLRPGNGEPGWSAAWLALGDADALDRLLDGWVASLRSGRRADPSVAAQLRRELWAPLEVSLADCQRVILVPDGHLAQTPWNALPGRRPDSYLIEDYALVQMPYGQYVARLLMDPAPQGDGFLAVGGVDYGQGGKWSYLKGTAAEVEQLVALRPGERTVRLSGEAASKLRLQELLPGRRYVHLATHGEFLEPGSGRNGERFQARDRAEGGALFDVSARNPLLLSVLVLAEANRPAQTDDQGLPVGSDSFLTAEEVMSMDLTRTELVVLSACETGAGKVRNGEGVFSLQRAFLVGGSRAVVGTLWSISDGHPTQALMERFYGNLWKKRMGKLDALREAQLWLLHEGAKQPSLIRGRGLEFEPGPEEEAVQSGRLSPRYWAAFELSGDWR